MQNQSTKDATQGSEFQGMREEPRASSSGALSCSVEEVLADYDGRRKGILNALLHNKDNIFQQCRPDLGSLLCLYAFPDQSWKLLCSKELEGEDDELPRPMLGINIERDKMSQEEWLTLVAIHSDSWLVAVADYLTVISGFHENDTKRLLQMINGVSVAAESLTVMYRATVTSTGRRQWQLAAKSEESLSVGMEISIPELKPIKKTLDTKFAYSMTDWGTINMVQFDIFSVEETQAISVAEILYAEYYEQEQPKMGGLNDPRMGTADKSLNCETCGSGMVQSLGHFAHLELAKPMFHVGFLKTILCVLRCIYFNCATILADENDIRFK